jgi:hypothetical protein
VGRRPWETRQLMVKDFYFVPSSMKWFFSPQARIFPSGGTHGGVSAFAVKFMCSTKQIWSIVITCIFLQSFWIKYHMYAPREGTCKLKFEI